MSTYAVDSIVSAVKTILDSHGYSSAISGTDEGKYLDNIIKSALVPAARTVLMAAPLHRAADAGKNLIFANATVLRNQVGNVCFQMDYPSDFLRFVAIKAVDWLASVNALLPEDSPEARIQDKLGVCANPERPVAIMGTAAGPSVKRVINCWGSREIPYYYAVTASVYVGTEETYTFKAGVAIYDAVLSAPLDIGDDVRFIEGALYVDGSIISSSITESSGTTYDDEMERYALASIEYARYIAEPTITTGQSPTAELPQSLYQAVLYQTAGMTAAQTQEQKLAEDLISIANNLMQ